MVVRFKKCVLKIDEISKDGISLNDFLDHEKEVIRLIRWWSSNESTIDFKTSGSTGIPKTITIDRSKIEYSAIATMDFLDPERLFKSALLCINPVMIGGAMVVFRSLVRDLDLSVLAPSSDPSEELADENEFDLVSLVPMQMEKTDSSFWNRFNTILVGGANFSSKALNTTAEVFSTFGMTETVSHFALRKVGEENYRCIGDTEISVDKHQKLTVRGTLTEDQWLPTNDLIELVSTSEFAWKGRADFVINTGGVKVNPEAIEDRLVEQIVQPFLISSRKDRLLGNKVILIIEGSSSELQLDYTSLTPYERPKEIHFLTTFKKTASDKIDRLATTRLLLEQLGEVKS